MRTQFHEENMHFLCFGWFSPRLLELFWSMNRLIFSLPSSTNKAQRAQRLAYWYRPGLEIFGTLQLDCNVRHCRIFATICNTRNYENSQSLSYPQRSAWTCYHIHVMIISFLICPLSVELLGGWGWYVNRPIHRALCKEVCETDFLAGNIQTSICHRIKNIGHHFDNKWDQFLFFPI